MPCSTSLATAQDVKKQKKLLVSFVVNKRFYVCQHSAYIDLASSIVTSFMKWNENVLIKICLANWEKWPFSGIVGHYSKV